MADEGEGMPGVCVPPVTQAGFSVRVSKIWMLFLSYKPEKKEDKRQTGNV